VLPKTLNQYPNSGPWLQLTKYFTTPLITPSKTPKAYGAPLDLITLVRWRYLSLTSVSKRLNLFLVVSYVLYAVSNTGYDNLLGRNP
jgi:hypothetical protein